MYLNENQAQHMVVIHNDSLPTPSCATQPERKETPTSPTRQETTTHATSAADTLVSQVTPLLGITPHESTQLQSTNTQEDFEEILATRTFQRYVDTPIQTLDGIVVNQPKHFLPLAQEARKIAEEIRIEKINEHWAGIPREQLLNQSFNNQLNSIQILEQLAPLQLTKDHLPGDIIDILERLGKADNIPHNQLYYIAENCADRYYSKVIETFVLLLKWQFADRQLPLINTARSLKFLKEYTDRQALIWKIFSKHENIPDDISDLHLHIDNFKINIQKEFNFLKEATHKNVENFQTSLNLQQTYSAALGSHINNIYHKISEIQQQLPHPTQHMNTGDVIQIDALEFDPDFDGGPSTKEHKEIQGSDSSIQHLLGESKKSEAPALPQQVAEEVEWPDAVPVEIPPQTAQDDHNIQASPTRHKTNYSEIPHLESDIDEEEGQFEDIQTYLNHHNTYQESQNICKEYRKRLLDLDDERYYRDIDCMYETYGQTRDHIPVIQTPGPHRMTQELIQTYGRGRGQACREELHGHQPFGARTRSLQSKIQRKIKKTQCMRQRYVNTQ